MAPKRQQKVELKARSNASPLNCRRGGWRQLLPSLPLETPQCLSADWDSAPPAPVVKGREAELHSAESLSGWALCLHPRSAASEPRKASPPDLCGLDPLNPTPMPPPPITERRFSNSARDPNPRR
ncbi:hypothetical protein E2320_020232, partial [Naja naja]